MHRVTECIKVKVDVVLEKSMPSISRRKASESAMSQSMPSSVDAGQGLAFEKPCGSDATSSVKEDNTAVPAVAVFGVLVNNMPSQSMSVWKCRQGL
jgi:hypothetical protein